MGFTLLSTAKQFASKGAGECDPDALTGIVNSIRQELYSWFERLPLFRHAEECFEVQTFCEDCRNDGTIYRGITLPRDYAAVEAMWHDGRRVELHDRWRQWQYGMTPPCDCRLKSFDMGEYPTERDLRPGFPARLAIHCADPRDIGKRVELRGFTAFGAEYRKEFHLSDKPEITDQPLVGLDRQAGVVKDVTLGRVILGEQNGRFLSQYAPEETIPAYKRLKITGIPDNCGYLNIRAARLFFPLYDDNDVVETDNSQVWEAMARAQRLSSKAVKDPNDLRSIAADKALAESLLRGDNSRQMGKSTRIEIRMPMAKFGGGRLHRGR